MRTRSGSGRTRFVRRKADLVFARGQRRLAPDLPDERRATPADTADRDKVDSRLRRIRAGEGKQARLLKLAGSSQATPPETATAAPPDSWRRDEHGHQD